MSHVLFYLPTISGYVDRVRLLMEVSRGVDRLTLIVGRLDTELDTGGYERFRLVDAGLRKGLYPLNTWRTSRLAERLVNESDVTIVHDTFGMLLPLFRKKAGYPRVRFLTSLFILKSWRRRHVWGQYGPLKALWSPVTSRLFATLWLERQICAAADYVLVQAPGLIDQLLEDGRVSPSRVLVLTNNVDSEFWCPGRNDAEGGVDRNGHRLLFVGGIDYSKGIFVLIEAMRVLKERGHPGRLRIVGRWGAGARAKAVQLIERYGLNEVIEFTRRDTRERLREIYRDSDLFIYQTVNDGSPRVVLEALASGLPVIASHHPGIDVIDPTGDFVAFTDFGDASQIAQFVQDFTDRPDEWRRRAETGRQAVVDRFSSPAVARQYVELYKRLTESVTVGRVSTS